MGGVEKTETLTMTRRQFLKASSRATLAGLLTARLPVWAANTPPGQTSSSP